MSFDCNPTLTCEGCPLTKRRERRRFLRTALHTTGGLALLTFVPRWVYAQWSTHIQHYDIPSSDGAVIDRDNQVIIVRWKNAVYAFALSCPHQNTALRWEDADTRFQCPKHHSKYQPDGTFISGRATRNMDRLAITKDDKGVSVDVDTLYKSTDDADQWKAAVIILPAAPGSGDTTHQKDSSTASPSPTSGRTNR